MSKPFPPRNPRTSPLTPKIFRAGARHYLHPKLAILDQIDCVLEYYPETKVMVVSYASETRKKDYTDYEEVVYSKAAISSTVDFIVDIISRDYIKPLKEKEALTLNGEPE
jgi:hypothetical protein